MAMVVCEAATTMLLQPGQCEIIQCVATTVTTTNRTASDRRLGTAGADP
ncbi:hypothetical protein [Nannocystis pusilla]